MTNLFLLLVMLGLGLLSFFALQELLLTFAAPIIVKTIDSSVRQRYSLVAVRNFWLIGGGALLLGVSIACIHHVLQHMSERRSLRLLLRIIVVEMVIIAVNMLIAS